MRGTHHGLACNVVDSKNSKRKYGGAIGSGNSTSGKYHLVHLQQTVRIYSLGDCRRDTDHIDQDDATQEDDASGRETTTSDHS